MKTQQIRQARRIREDMGLTLTEVSNVIGVDASGISKWERCERERMNYDAMLKLGQLLNKPPDILRQPISATRRRRSGSPEPQEESA